jgi:acetyl esterase/lipase
MDPRIAREIAAIGDVLGPDELAASRAVYADAHEQPPYEGVDLVRDLPYGPHERHRLDVFAPPGSGARAVLVFAHGGGFVAGDKSTPGTPHNENVGLWACRAGLLGVTMNYRLAPDHRWPAGAQDVAAAVAWLRANVAQYGGDPDRIVLMGSSAGATHVAGYAALPDLHPGGEIGVRGVALLSGAYDLPTYYAESSAHPYFGERSQWEAASPLGGLVASGVPLLFAVAEHDPPASHRQAELLFGTLMARAGRVPNLVYLPSHNHFTEVFHLNTEDRLLGDHVLELVRAHAPSRAEAAPVA